MDKPFRFTKRQADALHQILRGAGLQADMNRPTYLDASERDVRVALHITSQPDDPLYAGVTRKKLRKLQAASIKRGFA